MQGGDPHALTVRECLEVEPLHAAVVVAGHEGLATPAVRWIAVIEGAVDGFVAPGELVLSTGLGYGAERLRDLVEDVCDAHAAA